MSAKDFNGRLFEPVMARPRRPLSSSASTASCNMRFSLRTIMSGAFKSNSRLSRLLRLMTRRYRSFKSDVANLPPSRGTNGLNSGGRTGNTVRIIHSGRLLDTIRDSIAFKRLVCFLIFVSELVPSISSRRRWTSPCRSIVFSSSRIASAPILATKSSPYCWVASRYSSSFINWLR